MAHPVLRVGRPVGSLHTEIHVSGRSARNCMQKAEYIPLAHLIFCGH